VLEAAREYACRCTIFAVDDVVLLRLATRRRHQSGPTRQAALDITIHKLSSQGRFSRRQRHVAPCHVMYRAISMTAVSYTTLAEQKFLAFKAAMEAPSQVPRVQSS
jgi:hypothetical protein